MSNITKNLTKQKVQAKEQINTSSAVAAVKLLEQSNAQEDIRIANALGGKHNIARAQNELGKKLEIEELDGKYAGNVFTRNQIKDLAKKYNMRFLQSKHYCGNLDLGVIQKLKEFSRETKTEITDGNLQHNFYILAPEKCFNLEKMKRVTVDPDPAIFYEIGHNHYRLIHQWGTDFNIFNRISGLLWENDWSRFSSIFIGCLLAISVVFFSLWYFFDITMRWGWFVLPLIISIAASISSVANFKNEDYHDGKWNSTTKLV